MISPDADEQEQHPWAFALGKFIAILIVRPFFALVRFASSFLKRLT